MAISFNKTSLFFLLIILLIIDIEGKKISRSRGSGRSSSRRTSNPQPAPTSFSYSQASAPKSTLFGWQEKPAQKTQYSQSHQSKPSNQGHSYPSSHSGLSGSGPPKQTQIQSENIQRSNVPIQQSAHQSATSNHANSHSYPASNGLSGSSGAGVGYPQGSGLSGSNAAPPPYQTSNTNRVQSPTNNLGNNYPAHNVGNSYNHPQGPPPPYTGVGNSYNHGPPPPYSSYGNNNGGYGGHGGYSPQMPGYFGGYANNKGFGGMSRPGSTLAGVGIAGAGVGTILTGLALWNLARSTGHRHHTVIYDNRGQPVAVAPGNGTDTSASDSLLADLVNCTLTISTDNATEVLAIPCSIATSFTPDTDDKDVKGDIPNDNTKCIITVITKSGKEFMTTIPCSVLLNTAAQNNVTEPPPVNFTESVINSTIIATDDNDPNSPTALKLSSSEENNTNSPIDYNCTSEPGEIRDPINPCFSVKHNLTVVPLAPPEV